MTDDHGFGQGDLFAGDPTENYHQGNLESAAAYDSIEEHKARILRQVLTYVEHCGADGATCDQIEYALALSHQTASARCTEAVARGLLVRTPLRRPTRSGRKASVLVTPGNEPPTSTGAVRPVTGGTDV